MNFSLPGKFAIFFYGTFETASLKNSEIWPYDAESKDKFCIPTVVKRKGYLEGLDQVLSQKSTVTQFCNHRSVTQVCHSSPLSLKSTVTQVHCHSIPPQQIEHTPEIAPILADVVLEAAAKPKTSPAPIVLKKPVKLRKTK